MTEDPGPYRAEPCPCGHRACCAWHVWPVAAVQGVKFSMEQAELVAKILNARFKEAARASTDQA